MNNARQNLAPLTSLRFFAAIAVFLSHLDFFVAVPKLKSLYLDFFAEGYIGVTFFFVLSGFILTYNYSDKFEKIDVKKIFNYFIGRIIRIYPVHLLLFVYVCMFYTFPISNKTFANLFLIQSYFPSMSYYFSYNAVSWSLSNEMFFYSCLPFLLLMLGSRKFRLTTLLLLISISVSLPVLIVNLSKGDHWSFYISPYFTLFNFIAGVLVSFLFIKLEKGQSKTGVTLFTIYEVLSLGIFCIIFMNVPHYFDATPALYGLGSYYIASFSLIILVFSFQRGLISKLLSVKPLTFLGEISFSFYMVHKQVIGFIKSNCPDIIITNPVFATISAFSITLLLSSLILLAYENPVRIKLRRTFGLAYKKKAGEISSASIMQ